MLDDAQAGTRLMDVMLRHDGTAVRSELRPILERAIKTLREVKAVTHPLGFIHLTLAQIEQCTLRVHLWPPGIVSEPIVHNHIWHLTSYVITGAIENLIYEITDDEHVPSQRVYEIAYRGLENTIIPTSRTLSQRIQSATIYKAGDVYSLEIGTFHSTRLPYSVLTATLVLAQYGERQRPEIVGEISIEHARHMTRAYARTEDVRRWLDELIRIVGGSV
jgi:hypothetical protein